MRRPHNLGRFIEQPRHIYEFLQIMQNIYSKIDDNYAVKFTMSFLCALSNVFGAGVQDVAAEVAHGRRQVGAPLRNHIEVALPLRLDDLQYFYVEPQQQIHVWHDADTEATGNEAGDHLVIGRLIRYFRFRADALEELVLNGAHTGAIRKKYMGIRRRIGEVDAVPLSKRVAARDDKDNVLIRDRYGVKRRKNL